MAVRMMDGMGLGYAIADFNRKRLFVSRANGEIRWTRFFCRVHIFKAYGLAVRCIQRLRVEQPEGDYEIVSEQAAWALEQIWHREEAAPRAVNTR